MANRSDQSLSLRKPLWNLTLSPLAEYGLRGRSRIVPHLQLFGRRTPDERELNCAMAPGYWEDDVDLLFAVTKVDKLFMARQFNWNREECRKLRPHYQTIKLEYLKPFCYDKQFGMFLILYHTVDLSFWGYMDAGIIPYSVRLVRLGDKWTDVILKYPYYHFHQIERSIWGCPPLRYRKIEPVDNLE
jgi:hypothetical protein